MAGMCTGISGMRYSFCCPGIWPGFCACCMLPFWHLPMPFAPVHLLFINLLTDSLPAIAIGMEPQEEGLLDQPPRNPQEGILTPSFLLAPSGAGNADRGGLP